MKIIVNISSGFYDVLTKPDITHKHIQLATIFDDCFGDNSRLVSHSIVISSPNNELCIRQRCDPLRFKYHLAEYSGNWGDIAEPKKMPYGWTRVLLGLAVQWEVIF